MSPTAGRVARHRHRFPRVSGDEPETGLPCFFLDMFSPRERG